MTRLSRSVGAALLLALALGAGCRGGGCGSAPEPAVVGEPAAPPEPPVPPRAKEAAALSKAIKADPANYRQTLEASGVDWAALDAMMYEVAADEELAKGYVRARRPKWKDQPASP